MKKIMKKIINLSTMASAILLPNLVQAQATSPMEVSATVEAGCFIEADNINFGNLITPITNQSATSNMRIHCSKGANLSIGINYSLNNNTSGSITTNVVYSVHHRVYIDGIPISNHNDFNFDFSCSVGKGKIRIYTDEMWKLSGYINIMGSDTLDTKGLCKDQMTPNLTALNALIGVSGGSLVGIANGEAVKYSLELPDDSNNIWSKNNTHNMVANGVQQEIIMKANIRSDGNPTHRMTPDTYQDTLTVLLTY